MLYRAFSVVVSWWLVCARATEEDSPRIVIVGGGSAGIAAASRLFENGFDNVTILEAENRIGGRVYTTEFGGYWVDVGGQWVHGEVDNVAYEMAWPLGVIEKSGEPWDVTVFNSLGVPLPKDTGSSLFEFYVNLTEGEIPAEHLDKSTGEYYKIKIDEYFENHPDVPRDDREPLREMLNSFEMSKDSADSWYNVSVKGIREYGSCEGDNAINWKDKGYGTILDILTKKYPDPSKELPVLNNTLLNKQVSRINYNSSDGVVRVVATDGDEYSAEHVIVTTSLGVLKADHETLFDPRLSEAKINTIENLGYGSVAKIYLEYAEPWWTADGTTNRSFIKSFYWTEEDRNELANDPEKSWILGVFEVFTVEHKPRLLCCWLTGPRSREMEKIPEERVFRETKELLHRFLGKTYNLTEPTAMLRSQWFTNKHFRGTYSYRSPESERTGAASVILSEPVTKDGNPAILFAGEATSPDHYSTVHGAIDSGQREADRLIKLYRDRRPETETSRP